MHTLPIEIEHLRHITDQAMPHKSENAWQLSLLLAQHYLTVINFKAVFSYLQFADVIAQALHGESSLKRVEINYWRTKTITRKGDFHGAVKMAKQTIRHYQALSNAPSQLAADLYLAHARPELRLGNIEIAYELYEKALKIHDQLKTQNLAFLAECWTEISRIWAHRGDFDTALDFAERSTDLHIELYGERHIRTALQFNIMAAMHSYRGDIERTIFYSQRSYDIHIETFGENSIHIANPLSGLAIGKWRRGDYIEAGENFMEVLSIIKNIVRQITMRLLMP